jgi:hypothetical protein
LLKSLWPSPLRQSLSLLSLKSLWPLLSLSLKSRLLKSRQRSQSLSPSR